MNEEDKREVPTDQPVLYRDIQLSDELTADLVMQIRREVIKQQGIAVMWTDSPSFTLGAFTGDRLSGVIQVSTDGHVAYLVHPEHQGKGMAKGMLNAAIEKAKAKGMGLLHASVHEQSASENVLLSAGFVSLGHVGGDEEDTPVVIYELRLNN